jgi:hypothetical protein
MAAALIVTAYSLNGATEAAIKNATEANEPYVVTQVDDTDLYHAYPAADLGFLYVEGRDVIRFRTDQPSLI